MTKVIKTLSWSKIQKLAQCLPAVETLNNERHWVDGAELIAQGHTEQDGVKFVPGVMYEQRMPVVLEVNHARNMKKAYNKFGDVGVMEYFNQVRSMQLGSQIEKALQAV
jgi:hypothetical protein